MPSKILVVSPDRAGRASTLKLLAAAGYQMSVATTFEDAKHVLAGESHDLVVADARLGAFHGLHLILHGRARRPGLRGIVTTPVRDVCLQAEAMRLNALCIVTPLRPEEWLGLVARFLPRPHSLLKTTGFRRDPGVTLSRRFFTSVSRSNAARARSAQPLRCPDSESHLARTHARRITCSAHSDSQISVPGASRAGATR